MKKLLLATALLLPYLAHAGVQISEGNTVQRSCDFPDGNLSSSWRFEKHPTLVATAKNKLLPIGKIVSSGDALFYARIISENKFIYWSSASNVELKGAAFYSPDSRLIPGMKLQELGSFSRGDNDKDHAYKLLIQGINNMQETVLIAVTDNGYLCSGLLTLSDGYISNHEYTIFQKSPLERHVDFVPASDDAIALTLIRQDDVSATIEIKILKGGEVIRHKEVQLDSTSGVLQISGMQISFEKHNNSSIKIKSIVEPEDYADWRSKIISK